MTLQALVMLMTSGDRDILLVEDEPGIARIIELALADAGYKISSVRSGEEALQALSRTPPRALITDVRLPGIDGVELVKRIRAGEKPSLPILLVSAYDEPPYHAADAFVRKPFDLDQLLEKVAALTSS